MNRTAAYDVGRAALEMPVEGRSWRRPRTEASPVACRDPHRGEICAAGL